MTGSWKSSALGRVATLQRGFDLPHRLRRQGAIPIVTSSGIEDVHSEARVRAPGVVTGRYGTIGKVFFVTEDFWPLNTTLFVKDFHGNDPRFVSYLLRTIDFETHSGKSGVPGVNRNDLHEIVIDVPATLQEQKAIAEALSDSDALIESLEQLLAKKCQIKQGAMQELLTGKKRLPGFGGEWDVRPYNKTLVRLNSKLSQIQTSEYQDTGRYPVVDQGKELVVGYSDREDIRFLCPSGGVIVFGDHTCLVKFVDRDFLVGADGTQILRGLGDQNTRFHSYQLQFRGIQPTGYNRHFKFLAEREFLVPSQAEQTAIATLLADMDAEIAALGGKLSKAREIKQGMMQELLTGRIRLV